MDAAGTRAAFATITNTLDIWELTLASGELRQVTSTTTSEDYPQLSPDGETLLVTSLYYDKSSLSTLELDGNQISQIARNAGLGRWSPDGARIAYRTDGKLVVRRIDSLSVEHSLPTGDFSWSPDGRHIAVRNDERIWIHSLDGEPSRVVTPPEFNPFWPSWSPDGSFIAFEDETNGIRWIGRVPLGGGEVRQLTPGTRHEVSHPDWSPIDPDQILFLRNHSVLCLLIVSTGEVTQIMDYMPGSVTLNYPTWSFDGKKAYFSVSRKTGDIYLLENF